MSEDQIHLLRADIAALKAIMEERSRASDRNSTLIRTVTAVVILQFIGTVFLAGIKTQKLDTLAEEVAHMRAQLESKG